MSAPASRSWLTPYGPGSPDDAHECGNSRCAEMWNVLKNGWGAVRPGTAVRKDANAPQLVITPNS